MIDRSAIIGLALLLSAACGDGGPAVTAEELAALGTPAEHEHGRDLFDARCAACHGTYALGSEQGPPLVHSTYRPRHHGDEAFQLAVARGVRAHHWRFGHMPPVPGVSRADVTAITGYVRWLQRAAGID